MLTTTFAAAFGFRFQLSPPLLVSALPPALFLSLLLSQYEQLFVAASQQIAVSCETNPNTVLFPSPFRFACPLAASFCCRTTLPDYFGIVVVTVVVTVVVVVAVAFGNRRPFDLPLSSLPLPCRNPPPPPLPP